MTPASHRRFDSTATVLDCCEFSSGVWQLTLEAPHIARAARPGQFVMIGVNRRYEPLLRRPMSLLDADPDAGVVRMLFRIVGAGTALMADFHKGERYPLAGPLGNSFNVDGAYTQALLVGGGMGIPPLLYLVPALERAGKDVRFFYGARSRTEVFFRERLQEPRVQLDIATDDGSEGYHGFITDLWKRALDEAGDTGRVRVFACGPPGMLVQVMREAECRGLDAQVSLETQMPCGLGLCQGCVVPVRSNGTEGYAYQLVCRDGPVFPVSTLLLDRLEAIML